MVFNQQGKIMDIWMLRWVTQLGTRCMVKAGAEKQREGFLCCTLGCDKGTCGWCIAFVTSAFLGGCRLRRLPGLTLLQPCVTAFKRSRRVLPLVTMFMHLG